MTDQGSQSSRAEQRMLAVAKLKRAASLPRMKDGRRPPMHAEFVSEGEKVASEDDKGASEASSITMAPTDTTPEPQQSPESAPEQLASSPSPPLPTQQPTEKPADTEHEADTEPEAGERPTSPNIITKKRRSRSRSRSRTSRDMKAKIARGTTPQGDSSQDETLPNPPHIMLPMVPALQTPIPSQFPFFQQHSRMLRSPTPLGSELPLFYPGPSPPTPLPTLEDLREGLMRSNSASAAAGRRLALAKLTGGADTYDPSPSSSPTPPPIPISSKLNRNNTVSGGERIAARQNLLNRLGPRTRAGKETDADATSGAEDKASNQAKRRRRRSKRQSGTQVPQGSESDMNSTRPNTPAAPSAFAASQDHYSELRALSTTPNQHSSSGSHSRERLPNGTPPPPPLPGKFIEDEHERLRRRSVLIEEDADEEERYPPGQAYGRYPPGTPQRSFSRMGDVRPPYAFDGGHHSSDSSQGATVPIILSQRVPSRTEPYPSSPFTTPLREKALSDEDEEQLLYPPTTRRPRTPHGNVATDVHERPISWVADPVHVIHYPFQESGDDEVDQQLAQEHGIRLEVEVHDGEEIDEEPPLSPTSSNNFSREAFDDLSGRESSKSILVESETSPDHGAYIPPSPSSAAPISQPPFSDGSVSPQLYPARLSIASRIQTPGERSPLVGDFSDCDERFAVVDSKRSDNTSPSTWDKMKRIVRTGSSTGRRSRTNSVVARERREQTESSVSRESGASLSSKTDKGEPTPPQPQAPPLMQTPSASASILSLAPLSPPPRSSASPIPPPSSADMSKYSNSKLFPFPGIAKLEQERRLKNLPSPSNPDATFRPNEEPQASPLNFGFSNLPEPRERKLSHQNSDSRLMTKYHADATPGPQYPDYIDLPSHPNGTSYALKLPMNLPGVKQWLSKNSKKKNAGVSGASPGSSVSSIPPALDSSTTSSANKRPSLSDIVLKREWEDLGETGQRSTRQPNGPRPHLDMVDSTPKIPNPIPLQSKSSDESTKLPEQPLSGRLRTPDSAAGLSDFPPTTPSETYSISSSVNGSQGAALLDRLEDGLIRNARNSDLTGVVDEPPRKLVLSSEVLQVVDANTVKSRFLFLFNDILIIAKPVNGDQENLMDSYKPSLPDKKFAVKNVVLLRNLRYSSDRTEMKMANSLNPRNHLLQTFVTQFSADPEKAISSLLAKSDQAVSPALVGQVLFRSVDLDRARLGEYLSKRSSKNVLKAYLDNFGFAGFRVDVALRVFLHSIHLPRHPPSHGALEHLLDSFASRWYEANAKFVDFDKDMAIRLVRTLVRLNELLHGSIADEPGPTNHDNIGVTSRDFQEAFRRFDPRCLVSDEMLFELHRSIFRERLSQASLFHPESVVTIKRNIPSCLTYKMQSEPIVLRLPQADPDFSIEIFGQDGLVIDPPVLNFSKSSEASFRVMGTSLGPKTMIMCRTGPNAIKYSGLPQSHTIVVERPFMRNTFQLAFLNADGEKKRYMFSVDDPIIRNEWATSLRRQIEASTAAAASFAANASPTKVKFQKAVEAVSLKVLHNTLCNGFRLNASVTNHATGSPVPFGGPLHGRTRSGSRTYVRGMGRGELDLGQRSQNTSQDSTLSEQQGEPSELGVLWTLRNLEIQCQQNSSISRVLEYLQVGPYEQAVF